MECEHATAGAHCDRCVYGYYQVDGMELGQTDICQRESSYYSYNVSLVTIVTT